MTQNNLIITIVVGAFFVILGIISFLWSRREEFSYYSSILKHTDVREFLERSPDRLEPNALKIGGRICIAVGIVVLLVALGFYLVGVKPTP
jgi:nitrogen fixation-related uncharacterized protein